MATRFWRRMWSNLAESGELRHLAQSSSVEPAGSPRALYIAYIAKDFTGGEEQN